MKGTSSRSPWLRTAIVTALIIVGFALVWVVLLGPGVLILVRPR